MSKKTTSSTPTIETKLTINENEIYEKYEKVFEKKNDLSVFLDDYEKSIPIKKDSFMKIIKVMPKKKSILLNYILFTDTRTEEIVERRSIMKKRKTKLIEKDVFFKKNIPKANKYKPSFKINKKEFELFNDIFTGKKKIEILQPKLKEKTKLSKNKEIKDESKSTKLRTKNKEIKKIPFSYEKFVNNLTRGLLLINQFEQPKEKKESLLKGKEQVYPIEKEEKKSYNEKEEKNSYKLRSAKRPNKEEEIKSEKISVIIENKEEIKIKEKICPSYEKLLNRIALGFILIENFEEKITKNDKNENQIELKEKKEDKKSDKLTTFKKENKKDIIYKVEESKLDEDNLKKKPRAYDNLINKLSNGLIHINYNI